MTEASTDRLLEVAAAAFDAAVRRIRDRDREIEVLTQERDNALLELEEARRTTDEDRALIEFLTKGSVHSNA